MEDNYDKEREEIYSERVRAGKRTYFFDVKATRGNDYYLTITESKRKPKDDGFVYEKHKIFLYKEDFNKFLEAMNNTVNHVKTELMPEVDFAEFDRMDEERAAERAQEKVQEKETPKKSVPESEPVSSEDSELKWD